MHPSLSIVAPAYDEEQNLRPLHEGVHRALADDLEWELILVDDGSRDASAEVIRELASEDARVIGVLLAGNHGQTAATLAGFSVARGSLVATLDADLQNDPADLLGLVARLEQHDAVVGYRLRRQDSLLRKLSSRVANFVRNQISGDSIRDTGCALKVFRAEVLPAIPHFDGMHRFLPTLLRMNGYSVVEAPVSHHPRCAGRSKYGIRNRAWRAFLDLLAVRWMSRRRIRLAVREIIESIDPATDPIDSMAVTDLASRRTESGSSTTTVGRRP
jgi:glycosyltransferase involved in cell wall biosynthesis